MKITIASMVKDGRLNRRKVRGVKSRISPGNWYELHAHPHVPRRAIVIARAIFHITGTYSISLHALTLNHEACHTVPRHRHTSQITSKVMGFSI